ncbi:MAG: anti-sigma factor [Rhodobiaceae bacterium]|nr:anti-sigma factor [Rhodobiaceae bacterium]MCC0055179.1 anti-sigma factor [Rhodobiaceae bacterium]
MSDRDQRAAEYVLGTLPPEERAAVALEARTNAGLAAEIAWWQARLSPLADMIEPVAPPPHLRDRILARANMPSAANDKVVAGLRRRLRYWQAGAAAAGIAAVILAGTMLTGPLASFGKRGDTYVAMVTQDGQTPAMLVSVDTKSGQVQVLPLRVERPAGHSLEIWYIAGENAPRSVGLLGDGDTLTSLRVSGIPLAESGVFALTVEPPGGSPSGKPTGPVVYSGTLIRQP